MGRMNSRSFPSLLLRSEVKLFKRAVYSADGMDLARIRAWMNRCWFVDNVTVIGRVRERVFKRIVKNMFAVPLITAVVIFLFLVWFGWLILLSGLMFSIAVFLVWVLATFLHDLRNYWNGGTLIPHRQVHALARQISSNLSLKYPHRESQKNVVIVLVPPSRDLVAVMLAMITYGNRFLPVVLNPRVGLRWFVKEIFRTISTSHQSDNNVVVIVAGSFVKIALQALVRSSEAVGFTFHISICTVAELVSSPDSDVSTSDPTMNSNSDENDTVMIVYTSGSTGPPKPVIFPRSMLTAQCRTIRDHLCPGIFNDSPFTTSNDGGCVLVGITYWMVTAAMMQTDVLIPFGDVSRPASISSRAVKQAIQAHQDKITTIFASPVIFERIALNDGYKLPSTIRQCVTGGTSISYPLARRLRTILHESTEFDLVYGATEALPIIRISLQEYLSAHVYERSMKGWGVCLGRVVGDVNIMISSVDSGGANDNSKNIYEILAEHSSASRYIDDGYSAIMSDDGISITGETFGEIVISGSVVSPGYADLNSSDPWLAPHQNCNPHHFTGDVGFFDPRNGMVWYGGRVKDLVHFRGVNVPCVCIETIADEIVGTGDRTAFVDMSSGQGGILLIENQRGLHVNADLCERIYKEVDDTVFKGCMYDIRGWNGRFPSDATHQSKIRRDIMRLSMPNVDY